jgi:hypothetical protein
MNFPAATRRIIKAARPAGPRAATPERKNSHANPGQFQEHLHTGESFERWASGELHESLSRFKGDITRIEVHMSDENSDKASPDQKRCVMEARLAHHEPLAVNHNAPNQDLAFAARATNSNACWTTRWASCATITATAKPFGTNPCRNPGRLSPR